MHGIGDDEPHVAVDARAGVPAGGGLRSVLSARTARTLGLLPPDE